MSDLIWQLFSYVCGQMPQRCYHIAGACLPVCQRCTGLYIAMAVTYAVLVVNGSFRRGLPPWSVLMANIVCLLIMPIFGYHLVDPGPSWRFWSGLICGNALATLLLCSAVVIIAAATARPLTNFWTRSQRWAFWILLVALNILPVLVPVQTRWGYVVLLIGVVTGLLITMVIVAMTVIAAVKLVVDWLLRSRVRFARVS